MLKLAPAPRSVEAAWVAVPSPEAGLALLNAAQERAGPSVTGFELMPRNLFEFVLRHLAGARDRSRTPRPGTA